MRVAVNALDLGLLVVRLALGATFVAHGAQKVFGWWEGPGFAKWSGAIARMGLRPALLWAAISSGIELGGGVLVILGLVTPVASALLVAQAVYIIVRAHWSRGFFNGKGGVEFPMQLLASALLIAAVGPGAVSLDAALGLGLETPVRIALLAVALAGALLAMAIARPQPAPPPPSAPQMPRPS